MRSRGEAVGAGPADQGADVPARRAATRPARSAATAAAPESSAAIPISNQSQRAASRISSSSTRTISSTVRRMISKLSSALLRGARVLAAVAIRSSSTTRPARRLAWRVGAPTGSTPTTRVPGRSALTAVATPEISPPPPIATSSEVGVRIVLDDLQADRALAGDHRRIGEGMDVGRAGPGGGLAGRGVGVVPDLALPDQAGAPALELLRLGGRHVGRQVDGHRRAGEVAGIGHAEPVIAARGGHQAAADLLRREGEHLVGGSPRLERAGDLERLQLERETGRPGRSAAGAPARTSGVRRTWSASRRRACSMSAIPGRRRRSSRGWYQRKSFAPCRLIYASLSPTLPTMKTNLSPHSRPAALRPPGTLSGDRSRAYICSDRPRPRPALAAGPAWQEAVPGGGCRRNHQGHALGLRDGAAEALSRHPGEAARHPRVRSVRPPQRAPDRQRPADDPAEPGGGAPDGGRSGRGARRARRPPAPRA